MTQNDTAEMTEVLLTLSEQGRTQVWLAKVVDLTPEHLNRVLQGKLPAARDFRGKVSRALGVPERLLFPPTEPERIEAAS
jgi:hypothetical protein